MKRIVLFVEGEGEAVAMPRLAKRLLSEMNAWDAVVLDEAPFRVGQVGKLLKDNCKDWKRFLATALKRTNVGGILLVVDGDIKKVEREAFCAASVARRLAKESASVGAGITFSVAVVFAKKEFESWLIASIESLAGRRLSDGRTVAVGVASPSTNLEESPRDAKKWLSKVISGGYKPTRDQAILASEIDLQLVRSKNLRSFRRFEAALNELVLAIRGDRPIATPL